MKIKQRIISGLLSTAMLLSLFSGMPMSVGAEEGSIIRSEPYTDVLVTVDYDVVGVVGAAQAFPNQDGTAEGATPLRQVKVKVYLENTTDTMVYVSAAAFAIEFDRSILAPSYADEDVDNIPISESLLVDTEQVDSYLKLAIPGATYLKSSYLPALSSYKYFEESGRAEVTMPFTFKKAAAVGIDKPLDLTTGDGIKGINVSEYLTTKPSTESGSLMLYPTSEVTHTKKLRILTYNFALKDGAVLKNDSINIHNTNTDETKLEQFSGPTDEMNTNTITTPYSCLVIKSTGDLPYMYKYDLQGGTGTAPDDQTALQTGEAFTAADGSAYVTDTQVFDKWATTADGQGTGNVFYNSNDTLPIPDAGSTTTLYAIYKDPPVVKSIEVTTEPTKVSYSTGEALDLSGMAVTLKMTDDDTQVVPFENFETNLITVSPANGAVLSTVGTQTVTVTYARDAITGTDTFDVMVSDTHTITWDLNYTDATGTPEPTAGIKNNAKIELPTPAPEREGYQFAGWFDAATDGTEFTAETPVTGSKTIYAQWLKLTVFTGRELTGGKVDAVYTTDTVAATPENGVTYTYALAEGTALPEGLTLATTGEITGTPKKATEGAATVTIVATASTAVPSETVDFTITINKGEPNASIDGGTGITKDPYVVKPVVVDSKTSTTVTLTAVVGYEYAYAAENAEAPTNFVTTLEFTGLNPGTTYDFYQRRAADANYVASALSDKLAVETNPATTTPTVADGEWDEQYSVVSIEVNKDAEKYPEGTEFKLVTKVKIGEIGAGADISTLATITGGTVESVARIATDSNSIVIEPTNAELRTALNTEAQTFSLVATEPTMAASEPVDVTIPRRASIYLNDVEVTAAQLDPDIAEMDIAGQVHGLPTGTVTIDAELSGANNYAKVSYNPENPGEENWMPVVADGKQTIKIGDWTLDGEANEVAGKTVKFKAPITAENGILNPSTNQKYVYVTLTRRALSTDNTLSALSVTGNDTLSPAFVSGTTAYTLTVPFGVASIEVNATTTSAGATWAIGGATVADNKATIDITDKASVTVVVTAEDTTVTNSYTITFVKQTSNVLTGLFTNPKFKEIFAADTVNYTVTVKDTVNNISVVPTFENGCTVTVQNTTEGVTDEATEVLSNVGRVISGLKIGVNTIEVTVKPTIGSAKVYKIIVTKLDNPYLVGLTTSVGTLTPFFAGDKTDYAINVPYETSTLDLIATLVAGSTSPSTFTFASDNGLSAIAGTSATAQAIELKEYVKLAGEDTDKATITVVTIVVTPTAGADAAKTYTVTITRAGQANPDVAQTDANLKGIEVVGQKITPEFNKDALVYNSSVANATGKVTVNAVSSEKDATVTINGQATTRTEITKKVEVPVEGGSAGEVATIDVIIGYTSSLADIELTEGNNEIVVTVTALDGQTKQTYTVIINRAGADEVASDATLSGLVVTDGTDELALTPEFSKEKIAYVVEIPESGTVTVTPKTNTVGAIAVITVNGTEYPNGVIPSDVVKDGTVVTITVTATDGNTTGVYTVTLKTAKGTLAGKIRTVNSKGNHEAYIHVYKTGTVSTEQWNTLGYKRPTPIMSVKSEFDGSFSIEMAPGTYDVVVDRAGYLDFVVEDVIVTKSKQSKLSNADIRPNPGDMDKNGQVLAADRALLNTAFNGTVNGESDSTSKSSDFDGSGQILGADRAALNSAFNLKRTVTQWSE